MGRNSLRHLLSISELSSANLMRAAASNSLSRLLSTSFQKSEAHQLHKNSGKEINGRAIANRKSEHRAGNNKNKKKVKVKEMVKHGAYVNKETGEVGGPRGPKPTRYGDWERGGPCSDY